MRHPEYRKANYLLWRLLLDPTAGKSKEGAVSNASTRLCAFETRTRRCRSAAQKLASDLGLEKIVHD